MRILAHPGQHLRKFLIGGGAATVLAVGGIGAASAPALAWSGDNNDHHYCTVDDQHRYDWNCYRTFDDRSSDDHGNRGDHQDSGNHDNGDHDRGGHDNGGHDNGGHDNGGRDSGGHDSGSHDSGGHGGGDRK